MDSPRFKFLMIGMDELEAIIDLGPSLLSRCVVKFSERLTLCTLERATKFTGDKKRWMRLCDDLVCFRRGFELIRYLSWWPSIPGLCKVL